ncbi:MAG: acetylxylan esterase [Culturomica sp.]|jgi:cephalosporin-C deacetylase-like acetyl esterase|nr:acetylxylan esterase [Culturomica sp.]
MKSKLILFFFLISGNLVSAENYPYRSDVLWVTTPDHVDWIYKTGEHAKVTVSVYLYGILQKGIEISYTVGNEQFPDDMMGKVVTKNGKAVIDMGTMKNPGFRDCKLSVRFGNNESKHHIKLGFSPEKIQPVTKIPSDFVEYWNKAKEEAAKCPFQVTETYVKEYSSNDVDCYKVKLQCFKKGSFVYGYLTKPKKSGKYPIVFNPPGAGIKPMNPTTTLYYANNGIICFNMEIHGIDPALEKTRYDEISAAFNMGDNGYLENGLDDRDNYYMKKVYMACVRALDYLTALPDYDGSNLIAQGGSQGGALALITTGLDSRVTLCVANHPALSDMGAYPAGQAAGYPHFFRKFHKQDTPEKIKTMAYYDVVNFARLIKVPVYMTWGFNDDTCPPTTSYAVYNVITSQKEALITPINEHWVSENTRRLQMEWIIKHLK